MWLKLGETALVLETEILMDFGEMGERVERGEEGRFVV